ncbi:alginate export [Leptospira hartskeerlii]|uniref:Alginate export n=1 Tax=Leptospira hartskeerlii TaxID=2023177 RepID=A0A2M9XEE3_9LEPT|nr:alginate export family protein [Leptospira hartskeerlii]PJZ25989.1 alginate export [Leptospira hartskeerlii]PJZ31974.1 alginate export [Leptospira hartskeerlii]
MKMFRFIKTIHQIRPAGKFSLILLLLTVGSPSVFSQAANKGTVTAEPSPTPVTATPQKSAAEEEDSYVSTMKTSGLTPDFTRSTFFEPELGKKVANRKKAWLNDWIRIGAYVRPRYEDRYNLAFDKSNKGYTSRAMQTSQVFFIIDPSPYFSAKVTFQDARVWGGETPASVGDVRANTFDGAGATTTSNPAAGSGTTIPSQTTLREAFIILKKLPLDAKVQVGRQILAYGDQRMLGGANWTMNGLSYDGARIMFDQDNYKIHFFGTKIAANQNGVNGVVSANAPITITDPVTKKATVVNPGQPDQYIVGTYNSVTAKDWFTLDVYSIGLLTKKTAIAGAKSDLDLYNNSWAKQQSDLITTGFRLTNRTANNNLPKDGFWGALDWAIESAWQTGATGERTVKDPLLDSYVQNNVAGLSGHSYGTQAQRYSGSFHVLQTGYTFFEKLRAGFQYTYASGDNNRTDGSSGTFQTLPGPRFGVFPYWNNVSGLSENIDTKNLSSYNLNFSYKTDHYGTFYAAYIVNNKVQTQDAWYAINGAANTGASTESNGVGQTTIQVGGTGKNLYNEVDFTWMYVVNDYVSIWIGGGILTAGNAVKNQRNALYHYNLQAVGTESAGLHLNTGVATGANGTASMAHMFFFQVNAGF